MPGFQGRKHHWDFVVTNNSVDFPFICYRPKGVPSWDEARQPDVAGQYQSAQSKPRAYRSTHIGFGWGQFLEDNVYHYCTNLDSRFPQQSIMGPLVTTVTLSSTDSTNGVTGIFEYGTSLYTISGKWVNKINPSTDAVAATGGFPYDLTTGNAGAIGTVGVRFDANVVIGVTTASTANMVSFDGTSTFTVLSGANVPKGAYLARYYEDTDWRLATVFLSSSNPSVAWIAQGAALNTGTNWAGYDGSYGVGDQGGTLTGLTALERTLYIGMSDGLYYIDRSGRAPLLIPAMPTDSGNGKNLLATAEGVVWYPCKSGLYLYDPNSGTIDNVAPGRGLPDRSGIAGTYTALANFRAWTFVSVYDGTDSYIMAGRRREEGEPGFGPYIWHGALAKISSTEVKSMHVSALVSPPRLWMGLKSGNVAYIKLPGNGDNPLLDSTYRYAASGSLYFGADDYGVGGMRWQLSDIILEAEGLSANTTVQVWERRDLGTWTSLQTITSSGRTVITTTTDKRFQRIEKRLDIVNNDSTTTPVVRALTGNAIPRPSMRDVITATVLLDRETLSKLGMGTRKSAQDFLTEIDTWDNGAPVTLKYSWGGAEVSKTAIVISVHKRVIQQEGDEPAVYVADLVFRIQG